MKIYDLPSDSFEIFNYIKKLNKMKKDKHLDPYEEDKIKLRKNSCINFIKSTFKIKRNVSYKGTVTISLKQYKETEDYISRLENRIKGLESIVYSDKVQEALHDKLVFKPYGY